MNEHFKIIIMADHDAAYLIVAKDALDDNYNVITVPTGKTLLLLLESIKPDLILMDIEISDMDGLEIVGALKSSDKTAHIPIILLSECTDPEREKKGLEMGASDCLAKPFSGECLARRIEMHLLDGAQNERGGQNE